MMNEFLEYQVIPLTEIDKYSIKIVGNKAYNLYLLTNLQKKYRNCFFVPKGFVVINDSNINLSEYNLDNVLRLLRFPVIIRSSCNLEDSNYSFAGLFSSIICFQPNQFPLNFRSVVSCVNTDEIKVYCNKLGIDPTKLKMSVIIQEYIKPEISGVIFTCHPVKKDTNIAYIEYSDLSSDAITSGLTVPNSVEILKNQPLEQCTQFIKRITELALHLENDWGYSVDIEWLWKDNNIWLTQIRKITVK